jgi:hypothetical protein
LGGTIDQLFQVDVVGEIFGLVTFARKVGDGPGVVVECLAGFEGAESITRLRDSAPMCAFAGANRCARTAGKLAKIFGSHAVS